MKILVTNALICDPLSAYNQKTCDLFIEDFIIKQVEPSKKNAFANLSKNVKIVDGKGCWLMPGFTDLRCALRDPGFEHKEDLKSGANAALFGGFTTICCLPSTNPPIHTKGEVEYVLNKAKNLPIAILPYGAISYNRNGIDLSEMYDMHLAGAIGFTDGNRPVKSSGLMLRALLYAKIFNGLVISHAEDLSLSEAGRMHEGVVSTNLGLKGIPNMAEELMVVRDIELAKYAESCIHFSHISSKGTVDIIKKAKKQGVKITCDVAIANLCFTEENLVQYDTNFKVNPPVRSKVDKKALWDGLLDGTIDCIVSDHQPEAVENKAVEFEYADMGMNTLQTALSMLIANAPKDFDTDKLVNALVHKPNQILVQTENKIAVNNNADLVLFNPNKNWVLNDKKNQSKSKNSPLYQSEIKGLVTAVITKHKLHLLN